MQHFCLQGINYYKKLNEMEQEIETLKQENMCLKRQKAARSKLEDDCSHCQSGDSLKIMLDRVERERDLALSDVTKLQTERDILRERIKVRYLGNFYLFAFWENDPREQ